jgi:hypothetical protein
MVRQHRFENGSGNPANQRCGFDRFPKHWVGDFVYARERQVIDNLIEFQVAAESVGFVRKTGRTQLESKRISSREAGNPVLDRFRERYQGAVASERPMIVEPRRYWQGWRTRYAANRQGGASSVINAKTIGSAKAPTIAASNASQFHTVSFR